MSPDEERYATALQLHQAGRLDRAQEIYRALAATHHVQAQINLAVIALQEGQIAHAVACARAAADDAPDNAQAQVTLAAALDADHRPEEAIRAYDAALLAADPPVEAYYGLGCVLMQLERHEEALACLRRALVIDPDYAEAELRLAQLLYTLRRHAPAIAAYRRALDIDPDYREARHGLALALRSGGDLAGAQAQYHELLAADDHDSQAGAGLAATLLAAGRHDEALDWLRRAALRTPEDPQVHRRLGLALAESGALDEAAIALERAYALQPAPAILRELANLRRAPAAPGLIARLRAMEPDSEGLGVEEQIQLHFALGRACTDGGDPAAGFAHYQKGNALHRRRVRYEERATLELLARIAQSSPESVIAALAAGGVTQPQPRPIFIVGMPRSGSTLVEQILASHPDVRGGGELSAFGDAVESLSTGLPYPELVPALGAPDGRRLGEEYLARLPAGDDRRACMTDKMPANALYLGLIHAALPGARLVHVRRDAIDTCLSCYAELFTPDQPYAYDLGELGRYYRAHAALMDHWHRILPAGVLLSVQYEELTTDFDAVVRRLLGHCGLAWDARVRDFHATARPVRTASLAQVRRPLYTARRWRPDATDLQPLIAGLAPDGASGHDRPTPSG